MLALKRTQLQDGFKAGFIDQFFLGTNPRAESIMPHVRLPGRLSPQAAVASPCESHVNLDNAVSFGLALPWQCSLAGDADIFSPDAALYYNNAHGRVS